MVAYVTIKKKKKNFNLTLEELVKKVIFTVGARIAKFKEVRTAY